MNAELKRKRDASARLQDEVAGRLAAALFQAAVTTRSCGERVHDKGGAVWDAETAKMQTAGTLPGPCGDPVGSAYISPGPNWENPAKFVDFPL